MAARTNFAVSVAQTLTVRALILQAIRPCASAWVWLRETTVLLLRILIQKPHARSKSCEHVKCIERLLLLWCEGDIDALLVEGQTIQQHLQHSNRTSTIDSSRVLARLVFQGKIKAAMRFLTEQSRGSFLPLSTQVEESTVFEELVKKHPNPSPATPQSLINPTNTILQSCHPVIFDCLDSDLIHHTAAGSHSGVCWAFGS